MKDYVKENSNCRVLSKDYKNTKSKMDFKCSCGEEFSTSFEKFRMRNKRQCNTCGYLKGQSEKRLTLEYVRTFIEENSKCILKSQKYLNNSQKLLLLCGCGSEFTTTFDKFSSRNKRQCNSCSSKEISEKQLFTFEEVEEYIEKFGQELVSTEYKGVEHPLEIRCSCGKHYKQSLTLFKVSKTKLCPTCGKGMSWGERVIESILSENNLIFTPQKTYPHLVGDLSNHKLRYDFHIIHDNKDYLIEYDGRQHYEPIEWFGGMDSFKRQQNNDKIKDDFAKSEGIPLLRIPYWIKDKKNIRIIIKDFLQIKIKTIPSQAKV